MGLEKGRMVHPDGRTMLVRTVDLLREAGCETVVVALREKQEFFEEREVELVRDAGEGALGGMIAGMETAIDEDWLVVACDLPRLEVGVLKALLRFSDTFVVYENGGKLEPLCGFYGKGALEVLKESKNAGEWGLQRILRVNAARVIQLEDERALENANTPEDWARISL